MILVYVFLTALMSIIGGLSVRDAMRAAPGFPRGIAVVSAAIFFTVAFYDGAPVVAKIAAGWTP